MGLGLGSCPGTLMWGLEGEVVCDHVTNMVPSPPLLGGGEGVFMAPGTACPARLSLPPRNPC